MCDQTTSTDIRSATFSQALAAGHTHSGWLVGPTTGPSGQEAALVSHSVSPERAAEQTTRDTCGPLFGGSSPSADLQRCLASRLRQQMDVNGSPEYVLTWKSWAIGLGEPICLLQASARHTSGSGCGGWATPKVQSGKYQYQNGDHNKRTLNLMGQVELAGWRTPNATDSDHGGPNARDSSGSPHLTMQAALAGWPTPNVPNGGRMGSGEMYRADGSKRQQSPEEIARFAGGTPAETGPPDGYRLNPRFSLWLMGYPDVWASYAASATASSRKSRRSS